MKNRWLAPIAWMVVIFYFSHQSGTDSAGMSGWIVDRVAHVLPIEAEVLSTLVRKGAHVTEYAILGALLAWAWRSRSLRTAVGPVLIGVLYAISDEVHQTFVPGRAGLASDVLIDSIGVVIGTGLMTLLASHQR